MCGCVLFPLERNDTAPHTPSPRLRGEGGGSRMRGNPPIRNRTTAKPLTMTTKRRLVTAALLVPASAWLFVFLVLPFIAMMVFSVGERGPAGGYQAARQTGLAILATVRQYLGSLDRVSRVIKLLGMVNCTPDFTQHPAVINGCSELFRDVWGAENGVGARSAVGMGSLPGDITTEIEAIFEITP